MHLLGNLYFFLIFADNVEDYLGPSKFILLFFTAAFFGSTIHILSEPDSMVPMVGASGAISAIMVFYILEFPKAKLTIFLNIFFRFLELKLPAGMYLLLWLVLQARLLSNPSSGIAVFVHLGSALMGFILWLLWGKNKDPLITT